MKNDDDGETNSRINNFIVSKANLLFDEQNGLNLINKDGLSTTSLIDDSKFLCGEIIFCIRYTV
jgi:hypothetical protein